MAEWFEERSVLKLYSNLGFAAVGQLQQGLAEGALATCLVGGALTQS